MAAGVANLAIDEVNAEGAATNSFDLKLADHATRKSGITYIAAAIAAQPFERSC